MKLSEASRCTRCLVRWRQSSDGLCRRCEKELGIEAEERLATERAHLSRAQLRLRAGQAAYLHPHERASHAWRARRPRRIALQPGTCKPELDYVVVWAGDMDGAEAMGLPLAHEKAGGRKDGPDGVAGSLLKLRGERRGAGLRHDGAFEIT